MERSQQMHNQSVAASGPTAVGAGLAAGQLLVTTATYNEIENLPKLVDAILAAVPQATLLIVDDNSPDGTGRWAAQRASEDARVRVLHRPSKLGLGSAILMAMRVACEQNYQYVVNLDADFSHDPAGIPALLVPFSRQRSTPADVVIGSRYKPGGRIEGWPLRRHLMSRSINAYTRWMLGLSLADCSSGYRAFRTAILQRMELGAIRATGYAFHEEVLWHLKQQNAHIEEVPIVFTDRRHGHSKINLREAFRALSTITRLGLRKRPHNARPF